MSFGYRPSLTALSVVLGLGLATGVKVMAHDAPADEGRVCNPVMDGDALPVVTSDGRYVQHGGTEACPEPEPEPVVEAPEPEPAPAPEPVVIASISSDVAFDLNSDVLKPAASAELDRIVGVLQESPETEFEVVGHADSTGEADYNQDLSERRAQAVADYLERGGVSRDRFTVSGRGESDPVASNETREGRAQNRRVELVSR
jgi:OOP family OmpA-OmpF porin